MIFVPLFSALCSAAQTDRIATNIDSSQMVPLSGNVHGFAQARYDIGHADSGKVLYGVTLAFKPTPAQQADLDELLKQQQDRSSPNYHHWLTPSQFADRFGMSRNDIATVTTWLESRGFAVTSVANARNQISFQGTVAQVELAFGVEMHAYLVDGEIHFANANNPSVPAALGSSVLGIGHLHDFSLKPRVRIQAVPSQADPHFTSVVSGNHFVAPGDFTTIYDVAPLYNGGIDGTGVKIALTGQSTIALSDVANFRSAAGLSANVPTLVLEPGTGNSTRCAGDEGESDLDVEWSGAVAKNASITLVYAGVQSGGTCVTRQFGAFDALQYAIDQNLANVISNSYGNCESAIGSAQANVMEGWIKQANSQGQTVMSASGDDGAADCDYHVSSATHGLAVDIPAAIPEVTAMGGTEFNGDAEGVITNGNVGSTQYWTGTTGGVDTISSALSYIPEMGWNDTNNSQNSTREITSTGGGVSTIFSKPSWQTGTGVPNDGKRDVPDLALNASPFHDPYLFCSEDGANNTTVSTCTDGFRTGAGGNLTAVGGTSAAAPTFAGIVALLNQYLVNNGFQTNFGIGNANPNLYYIATNNPTSMNDVTVGNNIVPCTSGSLDCPASGEFGFSAGIGYDEVTGLGSVNANTLATAWGELSTATTTAISPSTNSLQVGNPVTFTATVTPATATGTVTFFNNGSTTALGSATISGGTGTFTTSSLPVGANAVVGAYGGINAASTSPAVTVNVTAPYSLQANPSNLTVSAGQTVSTTITVTPINGFSQSVSFNNSGSPNSSCSNLPAGATCTFSQQSVTPGSSVVMTIATSANMALPNGAQVVTVTAFNSSANVPTSVNLTVTATNQSFTIASSNGQTFTTAVGGTATVNFSIAGSGSPLSFVNTATLTTALQLTYTCTGSPSLTTAEITCGLPNNGQPSNAASVTITLKTTPKTALLQSPGSRSIFYAFLLPGLLGMVFASGSRVRAIRMLSLILVLVCSTMWLGSCGGSSNNNTSLSNPGTPAGTYTVTVTATTGGAVPLTSSTTVKLNVTP